MNKIVQLYFLLCIALNIIATIVLLYIIANFEQIKTLLGVM